MIKEIERFAKQMQIELDKNSHKGSVLDWKGIHNKIADLEYHKAKLIMSLRSGEKEATKEYIADCANILLSIGHEGGLYNNESEKTNTVWECKEKFFDLVPQNEIIKKFKYDNNLS